MKPTQKTEPVATIYQVILQATAVAPTTAATAVLRKR